MIKLSCMIAAWYCDGVEDDEALFRENESVMMLNDHFRPLLLITLGQAPRWLTIFSVSWEKSKHRCHTSFLNPLILSKLVTTLGEKLWSNIIYKSHLWTGVGLAALSLSWWFNIGYDSLCWKGRVLMMARVVILILTWILL